MTPVTEREVVATFVTYPQAQGALDYLACRGFPRECLAIVGDDLRCAPGGAPPSRSRRWVAGPVAAGLGTAVAALLATTGIAGPSVRGLALAAGGYVVGTVLGLAAVLALGAAAARRRTPTALRLSARRYWVTCEAPFAEEAAELLRIPRAAGRRA